MVKGQGLTYHSMETSPNCRNTCMELPNFPATSDVKDLSLLAAVSGSNQKLFLLGKGTEASRRYRRSVLGSSVAQRREAVVAMPSAPSSEPCYY